MKKIFNNIVVLWAILSVVFAIVVHICFKTDVKIEWLRVKWTAGDILIYISTISLGLLAVWQNKKYKEENEVSQKRLQRIIDDANELNSIQKIIDIENKRIERLRLRMDEFTHYCEPQTISIELYKAGGLENEMIKNLYELKRALDSSYTRLDREIRIDSKNNENDFPVKRVIIDCRNHMSILLDKMKKAPKEDYSKEFDKMLDIQEECLRVLERYLYDEEKKLYSIIYGNFTLKEVKEIYGKNK